MKPNFQILLIEDNPDHAELIIRSLPKFRVVQVKEKKSCLSILKKKRFDLILMDYYVEDKSMLGFVRELKRMTPDIPLIIITGHGDEQTAAKSIKAGADEYIVKTRKSLQSLPRILSKSIQKKTKKNQPIQKKTKKVKKTENSLWHLFREFERISKSLRVLYQQMRASRKKKK